MRYLGIINKRHSGQIILSDIGQERILAEEDQVVFEAVEIEGAIVLVPAPINHKRLSQIEILASQSIRDHRATLEGLAS